MSPLKTNILPLPPHLDQKRQDQMFNTFFVNYYLTLYVKNNVF